jgi:hypothetical protein
MPEITAIRLLRPVIPLFLKVESRNLNGLALISFWLTRARARGLARGDPAGVGQALSDKRLSESYVWI